MIMSNNMLRRGISALVAVLASAGTDMIVSSAEGADEKTTVGQVEKVWIKEAGIVLDAKMDTGTLTSSLDAHDIQIFTKRSEVWVRFAIKNTDGNPVTIERLLVRFARFKKQGDGVERRPVVELGLCTSDIYRLTQFNLSDRHQFTYPVLIGRHFLSGNVVVDADKKYTSPPHCNEMPKQVHSSGVILPHRLGPSGE